MTAQGEFSSGHGVQQDRELKSFGKYRLLAALGQGGMAKVYLALSAGPAGFNKLLVLKMLREDLLAGSPDGLRMFLGEARLAARLHHPNIVQTHEVGEIDGRSYMAMEYLDGQPLSAVLSRSSRAAIPTPELLRVIVDIARALHYAHTVESYHGESLAVVHRDVSPHNIFVTYDGQAKLLDFGVASTQDPEHITRIGVIKGKLDYIAPEQLRAEPIDGRADVFALGAVLWEVIAQQRFAGGRKVPDAIKVQNRLTGGERKLRELVPDVAPALEAIVERAIALEPSQRFGSAAALAEALEGHLEATHERPSANNLARALEPIFAHERERIRELIDEQLRAAKQAVATNSDWTGSMPVIEHEDASSPSDENFAPVAPNVSPATRSSLAVAAGAAQTGIPLRKQPAPSVAAAVSLALALGVGVALWPRAEPVAEPAAPAPSTTESKQGAAPRNEERAAELPSAPSTAEAPQNSIGLELTVAPAHAQLSIDGVAVPAPFAGRFRKDDELHLIEAAADGYRSSKQFVKFERDHSLTISLTRAPSTSAARRMSARESSSSREAREEREDAPQPEVPVPAAPPASARERPVPGSDIELARPPVQADDIDQANPYRKSR